MRILSICNLQLKDRCLGPSAQDQVPSAKCFLAMLVILVCATFAHADDVKAKPVTVPFELLRSGHMAVKIKVNGKGPYRVIFDTGAPINILNNKIAKNAGLLEKQPRPLFALFGSMGQVKVKELEVGTLKAQKVEAMVMDHPTVEAISRALGPIDGIVGFPFFARYKMTLDYQAKQLTFVPNGYEPPDVFQALMTSLTTLTHEKEPAPRIIAPAAHWGFAVGKDKEDDGPGVIVRIVWPGSPASNAGLKVGDRLLTLDGRWTDTINDCYAAAGHIKPGRTATMKIKRQGKEVELTVKPSSGL